MFRVRFKMGAFGGISAKPSILYSNRSWFTALQDYKCKAGDTYIPHLLQSTQAYPRRFGIAIARILAEATPSCIGIFTSLIPAMTLWMVHIANKGIINKIFTAAGC